MELIVIPYSALCELQEFSINGIKADYNDFGSKGDRGWRDAEDYCCGDMQFTPQLPTQKVLDKYKINVDEYNMVCEKLDCLSFGCCGWCS